MKSALRLFAASILVIVAGCDHEARLTNLENDNQDLQAEIGKNAKNADFDLQSKCAGDARTWFNDTWSRDKDTILLDYTNHYNKRSNQCFILVEYHYHLDKNRSWVNDMNLYDVYENAKYGNISKNTMIYFKGRRIGREIWYMAVRSATRNVQRWTSLIILVART
jgi:hypothetical protein